MKKRNNMCFQCLSNTFACNVINVHSLPLACNSDIILSSTTREKWTAQRIETKRRPASIVAVFLCPHVRAFVVNAKWWAKWASKAWADNRRPHRITRNNVLNWTRAARESLCIKYWSVYTYKVKIKLWWWWYWVSLLTRYKKQTACTIIIIVHNIF